MSRDLKDISLDELEEFLDEPIAHEASIPENLNPETKELIVRETIRRIIKKYGENGLTVDEIMKLTGFSRSTVTKHLNTLCALREVYSLKKGRRLTIYYPNGRALHSVGKVRFESERGQIYEITVNEAKNYRFLHVVEKNFSLLEGETPEGAIIIPLEDVDKFIEALKEAKERAMGMVL